MRHTYGLCSIGVQITPSCLGYCPAGYPVQVLRRGNDRQLCFAQESDLVAHASWLKEHGWSSYRAHAFGVEPAMWSPHEVLDLYATTTIRGCADNGLVLGAERFCERVRLLTS